MSRRATLASLVGLSGIGHLSASASADEDTLGQTSVEYAVHSQFAHTVTFPNPDPDPFDGFGESVALSADGTTALVSAPDYPHAGEQTGEAYVFTRTDTGWETANPTVLPNPEPTERDYFGGVNDMNIALSADGTTALIGASGYDTDAGSASGAAYIFSRTETGWNTANPVTLPNPEPDPFDNFGYSVALSADGTTALVGAIIDDTDAGADVGEVYVFSHTDRGWETTNPTVLPNPEPTAGDTFGKSVALSADGRTALIGTCKGFCGEGRPDPGVAYLFMQTEAGWDTANPITFSHPEGDRDDLVRRFGFNVALDGDGTTALVSTPSADTDTGADVGEAFIFTKADTGWEITNPTVLPNPEPASYIHFGLDAALSADGTTALISARDVAYAEYVGKAYVFTRTETGWDTDNILTLRNPEPDAQDRFGESVALSADGRTALLGAPYDRTDASSFVGEAYLFERGESWLVFEDQASTGNSVTVSRVSIPEGGFIVIASAAGDTIYGVSDYLSPGLTTNLRIALDTALPDDGTYLAAGQADTNGNRTFDASRVLEACQLEADSTPLLDTAEIIL